MIYRALTVACFLAATPIEGQVIQGDTGAFQLGNSREVTRETRIRATSAPAAVMRGLDKLSGVAIDLQAENGQIIEFGTLQIEMRDCRYPQNNPSGDAYVNLSIRVRGVDGQLFDGWMVASSPALSALEHPRYDIWAIRCKLDDRTPAVVAGESSPRPIMRP